MRFPLTVLVVLAGLCLSAGANAQSFTASVRGVVTDPTQAAIPGVKVTATDVQRNLTYTAVSDAGGRYLITPLQPGLYALSAEATGFNRYASSQFTLQVSQQATVDIAMVLASAQTSIQVTDAAPLLNMTNAELGQVVENTYIRSIPMIDREVMRLAYLAPGLVPVNTDPGASDQSFPTNFVSNGVRSMTSDVYIDGAVVTNINQSGSASTFLEMRPSVETVQEFKVQTNFFSAEFGSTGGSVVNMVSKSGTNEFHGSAWEYLRNNNFNANGFFAKRSGSTSLPAYSHHKFGAAVGGPFSLPKLYQGKNRTFFHASLEGDRPNRAASNLGTVPTELERSGNFSQTMDQNGRLFPIFNPYDTYTAANGSVLRRAFPGNIVPASMHSPVARKVIERYPKPNSEGRPFTHAQNYFVEGTSGSKRIQAIGKIDHSIGEKQRVSSRYAREAYRDRPFLAWEPEVDPINNGKTRSDTHTFVLDYTRTHSASTVFSLRYGVARQIVKKPSFSSDFDPTSLGLPAIVLASGVKQFPYFAPEGYTAIGTKTNMGGQRYSDGESFMYSLTKIAGAHMLKAGGEMRFSKLNVTNFDAPVGNFTFARRTTGENPLLNNAAQGSAIASMLLGWGGGGGLGINERPASISKYHGWYVQDDWKITRRLTLNLGFRYDFEVPRTERYDRYSWFDFDMPSPINGQVPGYDLRGGLRFTDKDTRSPFDKDMNNVQPRIGFAYALSGKTTVRAGYGIYYTLSQATSSDEFGPPFSTNTSIQWSRDGGFTPYATLQNPFPDGLTMPSGKAAGAATFLGLGLNSESRPNRNPQYQQWAFSVQRELPLNAVLEANYTGSKGTHLYFPGLQSQKRLDPIYWSLGRTALNQQIPNPFHGVITDPVSILSAKTVGRSALLRPYPQYTGLSVSTPTVGNSIYHSAQFKYEKRFSHGLTAIATYTHAKFIDDVSRSGEAVKGGVSSIQNFQDLRQERSLSVNDVAHRAVVSFKYDLPFGRGRLLGNGWGRALDAVAGGWNVSGMLTFQSGYPVVIALTGGNLLEGTQRPDLIGDPSKPGSVRDKLDNYFNVAAFARPAADTYGSAPRTLNYRTPGISNSDLVLGKQFRIREGHTAEFRLEAFNALNGVVFGGPNASFGGTAFGQINGYAGGFGARQIQFAVRYDF